MKIRDLMPGCTRAFRGMLSTSFLALAALWPMPRWGLPAVPRAAEHPLLVFLIGPMTPQVCTGDSVSVAASVMDGAAATPVGGATVTFNFGAGDSVHTTGAGGYAGMQFSSQIPGPVTVRVTASKEGYASGSASLKFEVKDCNFEVSMFYFGSYLGEDGVWRVIEDAVMPSTVIGSSRGALEGSSRAHFSYHMYIEKLTPEIQCSEFRSDDYSDVEVAGQMVGDGKLRLTFTFGEASFTGPSEFSCSALGQFLAGIGLPGLTWSFTWPSVTVTVPSSGGTRIAKFTHGLYLASTNGWGVLTFTVKRVNPQ